MPRALRVIAMFVHVPAPPHESSRSQSNGYRRNLVLDSVLQRFPNCWVASRFVVGREKFMKCDFFNYIKIKNHTKWESEKTKQNQKKGKK
jgi:hypothetical protein